MSCGVGCRHGSDPVLLWLWRRPAATSPIRRLAWEPPYVAGSGPRKGKKTKKKKNLKIETCSLRRKWLYSLSTILMNMCNHKPKGEYGLQLKDNIKYLVVTDLLLSF